MDFSKIPTGTILDVAFDRTDNEADNKVRRMSEGVFINDRSIWGYIKLQKNKLEGCKYTAGSTVYVSLIKNNHLFNFKAGIEGYKQNEKAEIIIKIKLHANVFEAQRRNFFRLQYLRDIKYKRLNILEQWDFKLACLVDISASGMRMLLSEKLEINDCISTEIYLEDEPIWVSSEIVWMKSKKSGLKYNFEIGTRFVDLSESVRDKIVRFIFNEERKKNKI
jgi:c-di-GMP-binding flagellar brake protein YcgR